MKKRQAKKIYAVATRKRSITCYNSYWVDRWFVFLRRFRIILRDNCGDHRIRKAIVVYERRKRKNLKR